MKKIVSILITLVSSLVIVGCSSGEAQPSNSGSVEQPSNSDSVAQPSNSGGEAQRSNSGFLLYEDKVTLSDGRVVTCITFSGFKRGGVSCDW